jgi:hypothetical protein
MKVGETALRSLEPWLVAGEDGAYHSAETSPSEGRWIRLDHTVRFLLPRSREWINPYTNIVRVVRRNMVLGMVHHGKFLERVLWYL